MDEKTPEQASKPRKRKRLGVVLLCALVVGVAAIAFWPGPKEPEYKGKKLSEWLAIYANSDLPSEHEASADAVKAIGTNALPFLVRWVEYDTPGWRTDLARITAKLPAWMGKRAITLWLAGNDKLMRANAAYFGFSVLGEGAAPAIPELDQFIRNPKNRNPRFACKALAGIGRDGLTPLLVALEEKGQPAQRRFQIIAALASLNYRGPEIHKATPKLLACLEDQDWWVASTAAGVLGSFAIEPELCIPALVKAAQSPDAAVRHGAIRSLGNFGTQAKEAVNVIMSNGLTDSNEYFRKEATNAPLQIAPEVLRTNGAAHL
jgi:hypothetical protein